MASGLKHQRSAAKKLLLSRINDVRDNLTDSSNIERVFTKGEEVSKLFTHFLACHNAYHDSLSDPLDIRDSLKYIDGVMRFMGQYRRDLSAWTESMYEQLSAVASSKSNVGPDDITPHDSVSNIGLRSRSSSHVSRRSHKAASSVAVERAILDVETSLLQERQALARREFELAQEKEKLELKGKLAKAQMAERMHSSIRHSQSLMMSPPVSFCLPSKPTETGCFQESRNQTSEHVTLNPMAPTFRPMKDDMSPAVTYSSQNNQSHQEQQSTKENVGLNGDFSETLLQVLQQGQQQQQLLVNTLQLPKVDLMEFDGDPLKYWVFIRAFENSVDREQIDDGIKLSRLMRYCTGKARRVIESCSVREPTEGYYQARKLLKDRFGNDFVISQAWVEKITNRSIVKASDHEGLRELADDLLNCKETLSAMGKLESCLNESCLVQIIEKIPFYLQSRWKKVVYNIRHQECRSPTIHDLTSLVSVAAEEANDPVFGRCGTKNTDKIKKPGNQPIKKTSFSVQADEHPKPTCIVCKGFHDLPSCGKFKELAVEERRKMVQEEKLCHNCLKTGHFAYRCKRPPACSINQCGKRHHRMLHLQAIKKTIQIGQKEVDNKTDQQSTSMTSCSSTGAGRRCYIALPIIPITVRGSGQARSVQTHALLDSGSDSTFCTDNLVAKLGLTGKPSVTELTTLEKESNKVKTSIVSFEISGMANTGIIKAPKVMTMPTLHLHPNDVTREDMSKWQHLQDLNIPAVDSTCVEMIIGQDVPEALKPIEVKTGPRGAPYAVKTALGWTVNGPFHKDHLKDEASSCHMVQNDAKLQQQVERFWQLDNVSQDNGDCLSINDGKVIKLWDEKAELKDGHYVLPIPFKHNKPCLPDDYNMANQRLGSLKKRLQRDSDLKERYTKEMDTLITKGFAERVPNEEILRNDGGVWYLPHHPVLNPKKPEKTRVVFDCAAQHNGTSLNDNVYQGPDLTNKLVGVLLRFRYDRIAFMADVEAMYNQVHVEKEDRDVLRYLWYQDGDFNQEPTAFRMKTHLFGGVWSPSAASYALKKTASDFGKDYPTMVTETVNKCFYVDDCMSSIPTEDEGIELSKDLRDLLAKGGFRLTKWISNSRKLLKSIPGSELVKGVKNLDLDNDGLPMERALGLIWDVNRDTFRPSISIQQRPLTRRGVLSVLSSVYDPLGLVSPYVLKAKMIFQNLCKAKLGWDDPMSDTQIEQWNRWCQDLGKLEDFEVPRCLKSTDLGPILHCQLHHFSDASMDGLGATSYIRFEDSNGKVHVRLVMSKAKLCPIKTQTIPRLELTAAVEAVKLDKLLRREMDIPLSDSMFWTDSTIVLHYIANESTRFQTFVANRIAKIHEHTKPSQWRHVPTEQNPADDVSRGLTAEGLIDSDRWKNGPDFLRQNEKYWPSQVTDTEVNDTQLELRPKCNVYVQNTDQVKDSVSRLFTHYSSFYKLKRAVAWVLRLKSVLKYKAQVRLGKGTTQTEKGSLKVKEIQEAECEILRFVQKQTLKQEKTKLQKLNPFRNSKGLLCVGGRLNNSDLTDTAKHPVILPKKHHVVNLIIGQYHAKTGHSGTERVLTEIRQKYWILKGRSAVWTYKVKCVECRKRYAQPETPKMADLPADRVSGPRAAFSHVGLDFFGPYAVKRGRGTAKRYGCIFTCLTTRAIHIEIAESLSTDSFINALQRFICRRGCPLRIRSDNGTNFVGANKELKQAIKEWNKQRIENYMLQKEITWIFNPPTASHMGGVWERQIRSVRKVLNGIMQQQTLTDESLVTLMCQVEAIINGRPLTRLSEDPEDLEPLTPNHLLLLRSGPTLPPGKFDEADVYRKHWKQVQYLADQFWQRWTKEYLSTLQVRQKWWNESSKSLKPDDIVLIVDDRSPRNSWSLGRIIETYPGKDGHVRSAKIRTQHTQLVRPVHKLCLIESVGDI